MTRQWVDDGARKPRDKRWVMRCDVGSMDVTVARCATRTEPTWDQRPLDEFAAAGWFIAVLWGDVCPVCLASGHVPTAEPSPVMRGTIDYAELAWAAGIPERPATDFDVATGRPLGPQ